MHGADAWSRSQTICSFLIRHLGDQCFCPQNWVHRKKTRAMEGEVGGAGWPEKRFLACESFQFVDCIFYPRVYLSIWRMVALSS